MTTTPDYFAAEAFTDDLPTALQAANLAAEGEQHRGQARMAYRLAAAYGSRLMYVRGIGWHIWDGQRWAEDEKDAAKNAVLDILRQALTESLDNRELRTDVRKCESSAGVAGVLDLASALPALRAAIIDLDADPYLLNCANGTLDLRTRQLREHNPADRITRVTRGAFDPNADRTTWDGFLASVLPDNDERAYLQRVIGQSAYGRVREHLFPVLTGSGSNGKGTAYGAITNALGDYATIINPDLLMASERGGGGPEMMTLLGARLVVGSETDEGRQLDAATMKRLTGGDELTARRLYQEPVKWLPTHQLIYVTNHLPRVKGNDPAVWRRIRVVPFDIVVSESMRDQTLPERLELSADAILTWAVEGWFDYEDNGGMNEPDTVRQATDDYQTESDALKRFIQSECVTSPHVHVTTREIFGAWTTWSAADGADALTERAFAKELDRLGYEAKRTRIGASRAGIALRADESEQHENGSW
ncbi:DNA primase family protein [Arthrobacter sp. A5]|uniref:DNA primase family protein n=1 Tax=Arthrobacter sp. A5 TaxID=576926 RepID=UPI003DA88F05